MYRKAWIGYLVAAAVILAGFWPSFYGGRTRPLDLLHVAHGVLATGWLCLLIAQGWLIDAGRRRVHRWLGWSSVAIAPAFVLSGLMMERAMLGDAQGLPFPLAMKLAWLDTWTSVTFLALFAAGLLTRRRMQEHARYMSATVIVLLPPALGRLLAPHLGGLEATLLPINLGLCLLVLGLMAVDWRQGRRPHPAFLLVFALLAGVQLTLPLTAEPWAAETGRLVAAL